MKITTVTVGKSVSVIDVGKEYWNKVSVSADLDDTENPQKAIDDLFAIVNVAHEKHSQSFVEGENFPPIKKATITELKKEFNVGS